MNRNLNFAEFGVQDELFDVAPYVDAAKGAELRERAAQEAPDMADDYGGVNGAHDRDRWGPGAWSPDNPIYKPHDTRRVKDSFFNNVRATNAATREEFVPTTEIVSAQRAYNPSAVAHQVAHSTGLDTPNINVMAGVESEAGRYALSDGNHRVNAALRRGQMLIPADVTGDASRW